MTKSTNIRGWSRSRAVTTVGALAIVASVAGFAGGRAVAPVSAEVSAAAVQNQPARSVDARASSYSGVVQKVAPAVVTVRVETRASATRTRLPDSLREFFGRQIPEGFGPPRGYRQEGLGSGVVIGADGYVLTNQHVIAGADRVRVELGDKRSFDATVVGSDAASDLAVLKIDARNLPTVPFGDSDRVQVGDVVLAVGNPLGLGQTVTMGIVSAKGRATGLGDGSYEDFIQTDAPINQGNSGGALVNVQGELVGINSQILSPSGGNIGVGFAIPSAMARAVSSQLVQDGVVHRSKLGVTVQPMTPDLAASLGLSSVRGALVSAVEPESPAATAGVRQGDVITEFDGRPVLDANAVRNQVASTRRDSTVPLKVVRNGQERQLSARLVEREPDQEQAPRVSKQSSGGNSPLGISVEPLTPALAARMGLPQTTAGLLITDMDPSGAAAEAGLQPGDVISRVNDNDVQTAADLTSALAARPDRPSLLLIIRERTSLFLALNPSA